MTLATLLVGDIDQRPDDLENDIERSDGRALTDSRQVRLDRAGEVVDEGHVGGFFGESLEGESDQGAGVAARGEHGNLPGWQVVCEDGPFFAGGEDGDDTAEGGGLLKEGEEVDDEADAGIVGQGGDDVEAFRRLCLRRMVSRFISPLQEWAPLGGQFSERQGAYSYG